MDVEPGPASPPVLCGPRGKSSNGFSAEECGQRLGKGQRLGLPGLSHPGTWLGGKVPGKRQTPEYSGSPGPGVGQPRPRAKCGPTVTASVKLTEHPRRVSASCLWPLCCSEGTSSPNREKTKVFALGSFSEERSQALFSAHAEAKHQDACKCSGTFFFATKPASGWTFTGVAGLELRNCYQSPSLDQH